MEVCGIDVCVVSSYIHCPVLLDSLVRAVAVKKVWHALFPPVAPPALLLCEFAALNE